MRIGDDVKFQWRLVVLVVAVALVATACSGEARSLDGPLVVSFPRNDGEDALITGVVALEDDGCVTVDGFVAAWPPGTTWDVVTESITLPDGSVVVEGDSVEGGGGYHSDSLEFFVADEGAAVALDCASRRSGEVAIFNSQSDSVTRSSS